MVMDLSLVHLSFALDLNITVNKYNTDCRRTVKHLNAI